MEHRKGNTPPPAALQSRGLAECNLMPLVGRRTAASFVSKRVHAGEAWERWPLVQLNTSTSFTGVLLDVDQPYDVVLDAMAAHRAPAPSVSVVRRATGHSHIAWFLPDPVHRYPAARPRPQLKLKRVEHYLTATLGADPGYTSTLFHNPVLLRSDFHVVWGPAGGYDLTTLADYVPAGYRQHGEVSTAIGRNVDRFAALMRWAGRKCNRHQSVELEARRLNIADPLPEAEVRGMVRSVEKYRAGWEANGWTTPRWTARQAERGRRSGQKRRRRTMARDSAIVAARRAGASLRAIAADHGISESSVRYVLRRDASGADS